MRATERVELAECHRRVVRVVGVHDEGAIIEDNFETYGLAGDNAPARYHQGAGQIDELWIVDVDGAVAIIDAMYRADTPPELVEEMRAIAESATFEAP